MANQTLLNNVNADTTSAYYESTGGTVIINVRGDDFGGGSVAIQATSSNDPLSRPVVLTDGVLTAGATMKIDYVPPGLRVRAAFTGSTGASNVYVDILQ